MVKTKSIYILYGSLWGPYKARVPNGISGSYMDAVFELVAHESQRSGQVYNTVLLRKAYYSSQVSRVCVALV